MFTRNEEVPGRPGLRRIATLAAAVALVAAGAVALSGSAAADPSVIYVSKGGSDTDTCGAVTQKCLTIQHGIDQAPNGATVQVAGGVYNEGVSITKGVTLQGAGASDTIIDGTNATPGPNGLVDILATSGDVTISGFTIENPPVGTVAGPYTISMSDPTAADHVTITNNTIRGWAADPNLETDSGIGIDSANTSAATTITNNDISGVFQGVLLEGNLGALDVSGNTFHDLITWFDGGSTTYPGEGVYVLADKEGAASGQDVTDNTFEAYNGIGIAYSAGYDIAGCSQSVCNGSVAGAITGNTFDLGANDSDVAASAIRLRATHPGNELNLTMGGNTGTVTAPTKTIEETPNAGAITITPTTTPDTISVDPTPTIDAGVPSSVTTGDPAVSFTGTAANPPGGDDIAHARYDITLAGTSGLTAGDVTLQYETSPGSNTYATVPLTGSATAGNAITGYFGPVGGFPFPASATPNTTNFKISVDNAGKPGPLASTVSLDEVSSGTGNPAINTLASDSSTLNVVATPPGIGDHDNATDSGKPVAVSVPDANGAHGPFTYTHGSAAHGTVTGSGQSLTYTSDADFTGTDTFDYTATDANGATATGTETITVSPASSSLTATISPASPTSANVVTVKVKVTTTGDPSGGTVSVVSGGTTYSAKVVGNTASVKTTKFTGTSHTVAISYSGTDSTDASSTTKTFTVAKVKTTLDFRTKPKSISSQDDSAQAIVVVHAAGAHTTGSTVTIMEGTHKVGSARVSHGRAVIDLPKLSAGTHRWTVRFVNTPTATKKVIHVKVVVTKS